MKPINFEEQNVIYKAEGCGDLPACKNGTHIVSCWGLDEEDIKNIIESKRIYLGIMGNIQPPIFLTSENPYVEEG